PSLSRAWTLMNVDGLVAAYHVHALDSDGDGDGKINRIYLVRLRQDRVCDIQVSKSPLLCRAGPTIRWRGVRGLRFRIVRLRCVRFPRTARRRTGLPSATSRRGGRG